MYGRAKRETTTTPRIAIIGTGFSGLCAAIRLKQAGYEDFTLFERGDEVGGVWRDNTYPGAACDVPWHLYSFSFEYSSGYACTYPRQPEVLAYQKKCAHKYGLYSHIRFNTAVESAVFDSDSRMWRVRTADGRTHSANVLISGVGQLSEPSYPNIRGTADFRGRSFHSARWDHDYDLSGRRVAVIGTGASAVQFIPEIAGEVAHLDVFQRSAPYVLPRFQREYGPFNRWLFRKYPRYRDIFRALLRLVGDASVPAFHEQSRLAGVFRWWARRHRKSQVSDKTLRDKLTPDYPIGCKRILFSSDYYPALTRSNVSLVTQGIDRISPRGVVTTDGVEHAVDTIIYATGFKATEFLTPMTIYGEQGRTLAERWSGGAEAYLGMTVDGFPNLFMCYGPNTNLGGNSIIYMIECQVTYILQCVARLSHADVARMEVRPEIIDNYNQKLQNELKHTVWNGGCSSWYQTAGGRITNNWPDTNSRYHRLTRELDPEDFKLSA